MHFEGDVKWLDSLTTRGDGDLSNQSCGKTQEEEAEERVRGESKERGDECADTVQSCKERVGNV